MPEFAQPTGESQYVAGVEVKVHQDQEETDLLADAIEAAHAATGGTDPSPATAASYVVWFDRAAGQFGVSVVI